MFPEEYRFPIFILASLIVFVAILWFAIRRRVTPMPWTRIVIVSLVVVVGGMIYGKYSENLFNAPWWIYYIPPAIVTLLVPPIVFRMSQSETWRYVVLAFPSAPAIHVFFSFFFGWHNYMPFISVPSLWELLK